MHRLLVAAGEEITKATRDFFISSPPPNCARARGDEMANARGLKWRTAVGHVDSASAKKKQALVPSGNRRWYGCRGTRSDGRCQARFHPPHEPPGTTEQVELIPLAAVDVRRGTRRQQAILGDEYLR